VVLPRGEHVHELGDEHDPRRGRAAGDGRHRAGRALSRRLVGGRNGSADGCGDGAVRRRLRLGAWSYPGPRGAGLHRRPARRSSSITTARRTERSRWWAGPRPRTFGSATRTRRFA
jgi:hypothetical protein